MNTTTIDTTKPFAIVCKEQDPQALLFTGKPFAVTTLNEIPLNKKTNTTERPTIDLLAMVPYRQIVEKKLEVIDGKEPILGLVVERTRHVSRDKLIATLPQEAIELQGTTRFDVDDAQYATLVSKVVRDYIGQGEISNVVISREALVNIRDMTVSKGLSIFRNLLSVERSAYFSVFFFNGEKIFIMASPERHLTVNARQVIMNPISGTFRKTLQSADPELVTAELAKLATFAADEKEKFELFKCIDEILKMMAQMSKRGGCVADTSLREMNGVIHTESTCYGLRSRLQTPLELFRASMFSPTLTGGPMENACRIIATLEKSSRRYYGGAVLLMGRDRKSQATLDSAITIRCAEIDIQGKATLRAGATIVRDSDPHSESLETSAKIGTVLSSVQGKVVSPKTLLLPKLPDDAEVYKILAERNRRCSRFLLSNQEKQDRRVRILEGKKIVIIDNEDNFSYLLALMMRRMGARVAVRPNCDYNPNRDLSDITLIGPGPGNPSDPQNARMARNRDTIKFLLERKKPFLGVCLGHQLLCRALGIEVKKRSQPLQGQTLEIPFFDMGSILAGFYNTFAGFVTQPELFPEVEFSRESKSGEVYALRSKKESMQRFAGVQFHPESIMTEKGFDILSSILVELIS